MRIEIRSDHVHISGYVNAVGRDSRLIPDKRGGFIEQVEPGTFRRALESGHPVELRLNHERVLGSTADGTISLKEDAIGLHAEADISDPEVMESARKGELRGWSFGFREAKDLWQATDPPRRTLTGFDLTEVSLIDRRKTPAYIGTSVEVRDSGETITEYRGFEEEPDIFGNDQTDDFVPDYSFRRRILNLKRSK